MFLTVGIIAARVLGAEPLADPLGGELPAGVRLHFPLFNLLLAPLFDLWDGVSMLSMSRLTGFIAGLFVLYLVWRFAAAWRRKRDPDAGPPIGLVREGAALFVSVLLFAGFVAGGMLWHRPMAALTGVPPSMMSVDFHSHTSASHDVRGTLMDGFDAASSRRWHARGGFDASYITDHNTVEGFPRNAVPSLRPLLCPGIEVSAWRAHIVLLGVGGNVDRAPYSDSLGGTLQLLRETEQRFGALSIASLPEYNRNHWDNLDAFVAAGVDGFEIVNASPKANEFSRARRDSVIALARAHDLLLVAVTDSHGWGATVLAWNLVAVPGWERVPEAACSRLLANLRDGGTAAVQIVERHHLRMDDPWPWLLTPIAVLWETWRALAPLQVVSWIAWIWIIGLVGAYRRA